MYPTAIIENEVFSLKIKLKEQEFWYGGCASWGIHMPLSADSRQTLQFSPNVTPNQAMPLLLSNKGRFLWLDGCESVMFRDGEILCPENAVLYEQEGTLASAYAAASARYFPARTQMPARELFSAPIFNTWIELTFHQTQEAVLRYARGIVENGFQPGVLMIDDGWSECYGAWRFHQGRFPDPEGMLRTLHAMGFRVMVWVCPYITADSLAFREAQQNGFLLNTQSGTPFITHWWNGYSAAVDLSNNRACDWLNNQLQALQSIGVDGFKFDGGDPLHYENAFSGSDAVDPNQMSHLWTVFGEKYPFNEFRASWKAGNAPLLQRLCDKDHSWGDTGIGALIPDTLAQGITGHAFICPDMVGGGEYLNFAENSDHLDRELFLKHAAAGCLMPSIQFSASPWRILSREQLDVIHTQLALRKSYEPYLMETLKTSAAQGIPAVRYMEWEFPGEGCEEIVDQFMLGTDLLVAPVLQKGATTRSVYIPKGTWQHNGTIIESIGKTAILSCDHTFVITLLRVHP